MSRSITRINKTRSIEKVLNGEKRFYAEYSTEIIHVENVTKKVACIEWKDHRSIEERLNSSPHFYYVALGERWESDMYAKHFLNKDKAEEYARQLRREYEEDDTMFIRTDILPFDD